MLASATRFILNGVLVSALSLVVIKCENAKGECHEKYLEKFERVKFQYKVAKEAYFVARQKAYLEEAKLHALVADIEDLEKECEERPGSSGCLEYEEVVVTEQQARMLASETSYQRRDKLIRAKRARRAFMKIKRFIGACQPEV